MSDYISKWHREMDIFSKIKPILILEGNVFDSYQYPLDGTLAKGNIVRLNQYLYSYFKDQGYGTIVFYDHIRGFYNNFEREYLVNFGKLVNTPVNENYIRAEFKGRNALAPDMVRKAMEQSETPAVVIMDFASRYIVDPANINQYDIDSFTILMQASMDAKEVRTQEGIMKNLTILLVNKVNDIPAWFYLENLNVKTIMLQTPSKEEREQLIKGVNFQLFFARDIYKEDMEFFEKNPEDLEKIQDRFIALTEGFSFTELTELRQLCKIQRIRIKDMCDVIDLYKFGIKENPWNSLEIEELKDAYEDFEKRVKGQSFALTKTLDVIKRAVTGMSNVTASSHGKPKGVLFFAGPTGTGKTETAKTLAEKLFGDENACVRFDMSEFSQSHSDQRLLGAPPGYVGYESGGQLTNVVKSNPFCILLFDEIEKAHPSILDKFLQILEDGRMTDGKGETVYFSETIIIFTSNLGIYSMNANGEREQLVSSDMSYGDVQKIVRKGIEDYFKLQLGRPEILNRIGENIVVFDFIRPEVAELILKSQLEKISRNMKSEMNIELIIEDIAFDILKEKAIANLDNGGRGIGNIVESLFVNPLSRFMFDHQAFNNCRIILKNIDAENMPYDIECAIEDI